MNRQLVTILAMGTFLYFGGPAVASDPPGPSAPEPVPVTRDDMKRALDASKQAVPRLPAPPLTEEEKDLIEWQKAEAERTGEQPRRYGLANNGRMRAYYLAEYGFSLTDSLERTRSGESPIADSALDRSFRTMLFWIVSRGNNCTYCLGHQEAGLAARGISDDSLAALDFDWSAFDDAHQAAFRFTRKLSFAPFAIDDQDLESLRRHFTEDQVLEIVVTVAGFNATNRWTGPLRIQQDVLFEFERPASPTYATAASQIAPLDSSSLQGTALPRARQRPPLESAAEVRAALDAARTRTPRFVLADQDATRKLIGAASSDVAPESWARLLATLPKGEKRIAAYQAVIDSGTLAPRTKAIVAYVAARHDRAWYALGHAMARLRQVGFTDEQMYALDDPGTLDAENDRAIVEFARTVTVDPALVTDQDFARLRQSFDDKKIAEIVYLASQAAFFNRLTEMARLPLALDAPRPTPLTRPELKALIEDVKSRTPRVPLPELSKQDREDLGDRAESYEARLRYHYLGGDAGTSARNRAGQSTRPSVGGVTPATSASGFFSRTPDPRMTLDGAFKIELFWIVSRVNNCQYCIGHQESKLLAAGLSEDEIAALDGDWSARDAAERAAFAFARRLTYQPHLLSDEDIATLRDHYTDLQILEMIISMAGNNAINRWKEGVGVPQRADEGGYSRLVRSNAHGDELPETLESLPRGTYLTPTSAAYATTLTQVAPLQQDSKTGRPTSSTVLQRPMLESPKEVKQALRRSRERASRLPLADAETTREVMSEHASIDGPVPNWLRLLANFPVAGTRLAARFIAAGDQSDLSPLLGAQLAWIIARQDRAWYAVGHAYEHLRELGQTDEQVFALDGDWSQFGSRERALFNVARQLAASPVVLTDVEVATAVELAGPRDVVQTINYTAQRAAFNRVTEAAGLSLED